MKKIAQVSTLFVLLWSVSVFAHCQVPCGIYNDQLRSDLIAEHITTIEKAMKQIAELGKQNPVNYNQLVRWVNTKEDHANKIQNIVTQYFMAQRIKLTDGSDEAKTKKYQNELGLLHQILVYAMKAKQTTDGENINKLREVLDQFNKSYFGENYKKHSH
jgi:nickel superoxide dismutase